jgi:hypothetical protein
VQRPAEFRAVRVASVELGEAGDQARTALRQEAVDRLPPRLDAESAGINAYLPAGSDAEARESARLTGVALEAAEEGRASLGALRLAERLAPGPAIALTASSDRNACRLIGSLPTPAKVASARFIDIFLLVGGAATRQCR